MDWEKFEIEVEALFSYFGYDTTHNTKVNAGQTDILAVSRRRHQPNLLVECKYHQSSKNKVGIRDVEKFVARVINARMSGQIDHGYLVTNTDFTAAARACIYDKPQGQYVFLTTYEELLQSLLDITNYLKDFTQNYEHEGIIERFVDLSSVDTTFFPGTLFDVLPGSKFSLPQKDPKDVESTALVINNKDVIELVTEGYVEKTEDTHQLLLNNIKVLKEAYQKLRKRNFKKNFKVISENMKKSVLSILEKLNKEDAIRLGFQSVRECREILIDKPLNLFERLAKNPEHADSISPMLIRRRRRWKRDIMRSVLKEYRALPRNIEKSRIEYKGFDRLAPFLANAVDPTFPRRYRRPSKKRTYHAHKDYPEYTGYLTGLEELIEFNELKELIEPEKLKELKNRHPKDLWFLFEFESELNKHKEFKKHHPNNQWPIYEFKRKLERLEEYKKQHPNDQIPFVEFERELKKLEEYKKQHPNDQMSFVEFERELKKLEGYKKQPPNDQMSFLKFERELKKLTEFKMHYLVDQWPLVLSHMQPHELEELSEKRKKQKQKVRNRKIILLAMDDAISDIKSFIRSDHGNLCVLLGDYGAGKTTIINRLMYDLSKEKLSHPYDPSVRIPLLINLRDYNKVPDFTALVRSFLLDQAEMGDLNIRLFRKLNKAGRFIFLLDGFDEMLSKVTRPDRRRCFLEIADFIDFNSKVIVTGRPGYFPDHEEFSEVLESMQQKYKSTSPNRSIIASIKCLQLMDEEQVEKFVKKSGTQDIEKLLTLIREQPNICDLARRPVLAGMLAETASQVAELKPERVTTRQLYELYTNRWIRIEEDKGSFRILIDPEKKSTFVRMLAMQMHLSGSLSIHYSDLDERIASYFDLETADEIDYFSHDIRTCSFLNRNDKGEYRFIHKSFMEYYTSCEYEYLDSSSFVDDFDKPLTSEMIAFLDFDKFPKEYRELYKALSEIDFDSIEERIQRDKDEEVRNADYEAAAALRDDGQIITEIKNYVSFGTMRPVKITRDEILEKLQGLSILKQYKEKYPNTTEFIEIQKLLSSLKSALD